MNKRAWKRIRSVVLLLGLVSLLAACGEPEEAPAPAHESHEFPAVTKPSAEAWNPVVTEEDPAVARVNGVPIVRTQVERALEAAQEDRSPRELLEGLIEMEVLAQAALEKGYYRPDVILPVLRPALVAELLAGTFVRPGPENFFTDEVLRALYYEPSIRVKFDHVDVFRVMDAQFTCCPGHYEDCDPAEFDACMKEEAPHVEEVRKELTQLATDGDSFQKLVEEWKLTYPRLSFKSYSFFYNVNLPHSEQHGYNIFNENIARASMQLEVGQLSPPVRSRNAWHVLYLVDHIPEDHRTIEDESVRREIMEKALPQKLKAEYRAWADGLRERYGAQVYPEHLDLFFQGVEAVEP